MQFFFSKLPEVSWEHFSKHYAHVHSDMTLAAKSFGAHHVQRYTQVSLPDIQAPFPFPPFALPALFQNQLTGCCSNTKPLR